MQEKLNYLLEVEDIDTRRQSRDCLCSPYTVPAMGFGDICFGPKLFERDKALVLTALQFGSGCLADPREGCRGDNHSPWLFGIWKDWDDECILCRLQYHYRGSLHMPRKASRMDAIQACRLFCRSSPLEQVVYAPGTLVDYGTP
jgi:hypothetical protein